MQEADIWSYGCLLLELLTLEVPYSGIPDSNIHDLLQVKISLTFVCVICLPLSVFSVCTRGISGNYLLQSIGRRSCGRAYN